MPTYTSNHDYQLFSDGEQPWEHRTDFSALDSDVPIVDTAANRSNYVAYQDAMFLASDTGMVYVGNGSTWGALGEVGETGTELSVQDSGGATSIADTLNFATDLTATVSNGVATIDSTASGGTSDATATEGVALERDHAGPLIHGTYHDNSAITGTEWGMAFNAADGLTIDSAVMDVNLGTALHDTISIKFYQVDSLTTTNISTPATPVATTTSQPMSGTPERVDLGFTVPTGDGYSTYCLAVDHVADSNGSHLHVRRPGAWNGWGDYSDPAFDLLQGGRLNNPTSSDYSNLYLYFCDIAYGEPTERVSSPWSHDVDEIYMRPSDPTEEYDVGPRSLWIETDG